MRPGSAACCFFQLQEVRAAGAPVILLLTGRAVRQYNFLSRHVSASTCRSGGIGRRAGFRCLLHSVAVRVQVPSPALKTRKSLRSFFASFLKSRAGLRTAPQTKRRDVRTGFMKSAGVLSAAGSARETPHGFLAGRSAVGSAWETPHGFLAGRSAAGSARETPHGFLAGRSAAGSAGKLRAGFGKCSREEDPGTAQAGSTKPYGIGR